MGLGEREIRKQTAELFALCFHSLPKHSKSLIPVTLFSFCHTELCATANDIKVGRRKQINLFLSVISSVGSQ
jgi:hypothetical protein